MLVCGWHAACWAPAREAAIWPAWAGLEPIPPQGSRKMLPYPTILTRAIGPSYTTGLLLGSGQKMSFGTN